jgi:hypothetical protein
VEEASSNNRQTKMELGAAEVDTASWVPDFDEVDFDNDGCTGFTPNIITPTAAEEHVAIEHAFGGWAFTENEMNAMDDYIVNTDNDPPMPPPPEDAPTPSISNLTSSKTSPTTNNSGNGNSPVQRRSKMQLAREKYRKYVTSPKEAKKSEEEAAKQEARHAAEKERARKQNKKDKFKKMIKYKCRDYEALHKSSDSLQKSSDSEVRLNPVLEPWVNPDNYKEKLGNVVEGEEPSGGTRDEAASQSDKNNDPLAKENDGGEVEVQASAVAGEGRVRSQDIFRRKGGESSSAVVPSPSSKDLTDILKDVQNNLEVSAITKSSSFILESAAEIDYDFNIDSTPINLRDRSFQEKIDDKIFPPSPPKLAEVEDPPLDPNTPGGKFSFFTCGIMSADASPQQVMIDFSRDLKQGMKKSVRNFFGQCDIVESGGVDVLSESMEETKNNWKQNVNKNNSTTTTKDYVGFGLQK